MTLVLVHGNPETEAIWDDLVPHLPAVTSFVFFSPLHPDLAVRFLRALTVPIYAYRDRLADQLTRLAQPIDLVGHDWGGGHVMRIAIEHPALIRSWASDILGGFDADYVWHDMAQIWQTAQVGEQAIAQMLGQSVEALTQRYEGLGMTAAIARKVGSWRERGHGQGNPGAVQIRRATGDARFRNPLATGSRQAGPGVDRHRGPLLRRGGARAPICRPRRRRSCRPEGGGSLVDVPAAKAGR